MRKVVNLSLASSSAGFTLCVTWVILLFCVGAAFGDGAGKGPNSVLILPFYVSPGSDSKKLGELAEYADKRLRSEIDLSGGDLTILSADATRKLVGARRLPFTEKEAGEIAGDEAGLVIFGSFGHEDGFYRLNAVMWDLRKGRRAVSTDLKVRHLPELLGVVNVFIHNVNKLIHGTPRLPFYRAGGSGPNGLSPGGRTSPLVSLPKNSGPWRSSSINKALRAVAIGDLDGDKKNETVLLDEDQITIRRFEDGSLRTLAQLSEPPYRYIALELEDLDGDGVCEMILCYQTPTGVESAIYRYLNRNFTSAGEFPNLIVRTIADPTDYTRRILVGQRTDQPDIFSGEMVKFKLDQSGLTSIGKVVLPPGTLLLSYVSGRIGNPARPLRIILNQDQRLMVFDDENRLLASPSDRLYGLKRTIRIRAKGTPRHICYPGKLMLADTNGDGEKELLVIKHTNNSSLIEDLAWDGHQMKTNWRTVETPGIIADFAVGGFKNAGSRSLVVVLVRYHFIFGLLRDTRSTVFAYDMTP
ncbi:hypothetical protein ACFL2Q_04170 [Thermodesulfobacteriota bacterium]